MTVTNNTKTQIYACIALVPSENLQGSQKVFDIYNSILLKRRDIEEFPMTDRVVIRMNDWVNKSKIEEYGKISNF